MSASILKVFMSCNGRYGRMEESTVTKLNIPILVFYQIADDCLIAFPNEVMK